jgi:hypothetical protein
MAPHVKLFVLALLQPHVELSYVTQLLSEVFGSADFIGPIHPFDCTTYYDDEMGTGLSRTVIGFRGPHYADILIGAKLACIELEKGCAVDGKRTVNLDIGYLDHHKIVLASTKGAGHKIYLDSGIYADLIARYTRSSYEAMPWAFPDFKDGRYNPEFLTLRQMALEGPGSAP